jgi:tRNA threonylcarbamoyladenosine biosynthesis protein TsaE
VATFISNSPDETEDFGRRFAENVQPGDVLAVTGELGSGKTQFVKGLVAGVRSTDPVTSPTFTLIHEYSHGRLPVYHFDFFRVEDRQSAGRLGLDDYFFGTGICVIEWADRFRDLIPPNAQWIAFELKSENQRAIRFQGAAAFQPPFTIDGGLETAAP